MLPNKVLVQLHRCKQHPENVTLLHKDPKTTTLTFSHQFTLNFTQFWAVQMCLLDHIHTLYFAQFDKNKTNIFFVSRSVCLLIDSRQTRCTARGDVSWRSVCVPVPRWITFATDVAWQQNPQLIDYSFFQATQNLQCLLRREDMKCTCCEISKQLFHRSWCFLNPAVFGLRAVKIWTVFGPWTT